jgi:heptosyltransferase-2
MLLTDHLPAPKRRDVLPYSNSTTDPSDWAPIPAVDYYIGAARFMLNEYELSVPESVPCMELTVTDEERAAGDAILARVSINESTPLAILNPGGNNPAKRWPADRFACLADHLCEQHRMTVLVSGSPNEADLVEDIIARCAPTTRTVALPPLGVRLSSLKRIVQRCKVMITNDTGPRHIAAALGVPVVTLFGPTDHRWTTIPFDQESILTAAPSLPEEEVSNDHPERCAITNITLDSVIESTDALLARTDTRSPA